MMGKFAEGYQRGLVIPDFPIPKSSADLSVICEKGEPGVALMEFDGQETHGHFKAVALIRCKDCKHRRVNENFGKRGYLPIKAICDLDTDDIFELGRCAENDDWFCADAEPKTE